MLPQRQHPIEQVHRQEDRVGRYIRNQLASDKPFCCSPPRAGQRTEVGQGWGQEARAGGLPFSEVAVDLCDVAELRVWLGTYRNQLLLRWDFARLLNLNGVFI